MIINPDSYETLYGAIPCADFLIDSWFLNEECLGQIKAFHAASDSTDDERLVEFVAGLSEALAASRVFRLSDASLVAGQRAQYTYRQLWETAHDQGAAPAGLEAEPLQDLLRAARVRGLTSLFLTVDQVAQVRGPDGAVRDQLLPGALSLQLHYEPFFDAMNWYACTLHLWSPSWSLMRPDNDVDVAMIYLMHRGYVLASEPGAIGSGRAQLRDLLRHRDIREVRREFDRSGGLRLTEEEYEFCQTGVIAIEDEDALPLQGNQELADLNRPPLLQLVRSLERITGSAFTWKTPLA